MGTALSTRGASHAGRREQERSAEELRKWELRAKQAYWRFLQGEPDQPLAKRNWQDLEGELHDRLAPEDEPNARRIAGWTLDVLLEKSSALDADSVLGAEIAGKVARGAFRALGGFSEDRNKKRNALIHLLPIVARSCSKDKCAVLRQMLTLDTNTDPNAAAREAFTRIFDGLITAPPELLSDQQATHLARALGQDFVGDEGLAAEIFSCQEPRSDAHRGRLAACESAFQDGRASRPQPPDTKSQGLKRRRNDGEEQGPGSSPADPAAKRPVTQAAPAAAAARADRKSLLTGDKQECLTWIQNRFAQALADGPEKADWLAVQTDVRGRVASAERHSQSEQATWMMEAVLDNALLIGRPATEMLARATFQAISADGSEVAALKRLLPVIAKSTWPLKGQVLHKMQLPQPLPSGDIAKSANANIAGQLITALSELPDAELQSVMGMVSSNNAFAGYIGQELRGPFIDQLVYHSHPMGTLRVRLPTAVTDDQATRIARAAGLGFTRNRSDASTFFNTHTYVKDGQDEARLAACMKAFQEGLASRASAAPKK